MSGAVYASFHSDPPSSIDQIGSAMPSMSRIRRALIAALLAPLLALALASPAAAVIYYPWQGTYATVNVYGRTSPSATASTVYLYQGGQVVYYTCWTTGTSVQGDNIWYLTRPTPSDAAHQGYVAGWYLQTGHDPNPSVGHC